MAAGDTSRLFVVERPGAIRIIRNGVVVATPFLDITNLTSLGGERGLLSLAFHPQYVENGQFFVYYTDVTDGGTRVVRYNVSADPDVADPSSAHLIIAVDQPFNNHNGGQIAFGPDGMLYVGLGDGGSAGDPLGSGQDLSSLLGSIIRLDVDGGDPFAIPSDNPHVADPNARDEIWVSGLRNPWRFSFDRRTGDLYIGDVGQDEVEEVDVHSAAAPGGANYGWNTMEGSRCFRSTNCDTTGLTLPVLEYLHNAGGGCSITGGYVYRGSRIPALVGRYLYGDFCSEFVRSFVYDGSAA
ncbi:MAG: PQQ-dependent sugar dehydrogenase, partial [Gemmatimonadales bacterium]